MIIDELIEHGIKKAGAGKVKDVRAGLGYTCVMLEDGSCGLAYTFRNELGPCCGILNDAGSYIGREAAELISWAKDGHRLRAAIGMAAINAVINNAGADWDTGNVTNVLDVGACDTFGMIGLFRPILAEMRRRTKNIYVFEQKASAETGLYAGDMIPVHLPKCDVVVITASSLINHTIDDVIPYCQNARQVCLVGPSTPLCPEAFCRYPVTLLAGSVVLNPQRALEIVSQGGGTMALKPAVRQVLAAVK